MPLQERKTQGDAAGDGRAANTLFDTARVADIRSLGSRLATLRRSYERATRPSMDDFALLPSLYEAYRSVFARRGCPDQALRVYHRKKFLLAVVYLYSPKTLAGAKLRVGLRSRITRLLGIKADTPVSDNCSSMLDLYRLYRDFRSDTDEVLSAMARAVPAVRKALGLASDYGDAQETANASAQTAGFQSPLPGL